MEQIKRNNAVQIPTTKLEIELEAGKKPVVFDKDSPELKEYNSNAMKEYHSKLMVYLRNPNIEADKKDILDSETGESTYEVNIKAMWDEAKLNAELALYEKLKAKPAKGKE